MFFFRNIFNLIFLRETIDIVEVEVPRGGVISVILGVVGVKLVVEKFIADVFGLMILVKMVVGIDDIVIGVVVVVKVDSIVVDNVAVIIFDAVVDDVSLNAAVAIECIIFVVVIHRCTVGEKSPPSTRIPLKGYLGL